MARDDEIFQDCETSPTNTSDLNNSIVKKVTSLIPISISKWFNKTQPRRRDSDSDDESFILEQPPAKRARPATDELQTLYMSNKLANGSCTKKTQVKTTELLNNIRPRQTFNRYNRNDEPVAGPSGLQHDFATPKCTVNGDKKTDSGGSTSGCSSMAQKQSVSPVAEPRVSKRFTPSTQSPRTLFDEFTPPGNKSLASRRPSFNPSAFGKTSLQDTTLSSERVTSSPFYAGRTMFGGASSYPRQLFSQSNTTLRNSIQVKPANEQAMKSSSASMSQTARRIMDVLENYSTPVEDAKKIPRLNFSSRIDSADQSKKLIQRTPYSRNALIRKSPPIKGLTVPKIPSMAEVIELRRKLLSTHKPEQSVNPPNTTISTPIITSSTFSSTPKPTPKITSPTTTQTSKKPKDPEPQRKRENLKTQQNQTEVPELDLPNIPLPITNLPKFEFTPKPIEPTKKSIFSNVMTSTPKEIKKLKEFEFVSPIPIDKSATIAKNLMSINNFKFSKPINAKIGSSKQKLNRWECSKCSVKNNQANDRCVACTTLRPGSKPTIVEPIKKSNTPPKEEFKNDLSKFTKKTNEWECPSCMVRNLNNRMTCLCCEAQRPSTTSNKPTKSNDVISGFSKTSNEWECPSCMIRNGNSVLKCACCETPKPGTDPAPKKLGFGGIQLPKTTEFKFGVDKVDSGPKPITWECPSCMVRNKDEIPTCVCCETPKPGTSSGLPKGGLILEPTTQFKFGIDPVTTVATTFTFGATPTTTPPKSTFTFGVPAEPKKYNTGVDFGTERSPASNQYGSPKTISSVTYSTSTTSTVNFGGGKTSMASFGNTNENKAPTSPIFTTSLDLKPIVFGTPTTTTNNTSNTSPKLTTSSITFGNNTTTNVTFGSNATKTSNVTFGNNATKTSNVTFGNNATTSNITFGNNTTTTSNVTFGNNATTTSNVTFGNNPTTTSNVTFGNNPTTTSNITFGNNPTTTSNVTFGNNTSNVTFGSNPTTTSNVTFGNNPTTTFGNTSTFGNTPTSSVTFGNNFGSTATTFGGNTTTTSSLSTTPTPSFGVSTFGSTSTTTTLFGNFAKPAENKFSFSASPSFAFGNTEKPKEEPPKLFGGNSFPAQASPPKFGGFNNTFGSTAVTQAPTFGAVTQAPSFGSTTQAPTFGAVTQASTFGGAVTQASTFGGAVTQASTFGGSGFGASTFGSTSNNFAAPAFGAAQNNWGQNNSTFQFGASQPAQQPSSMFSFGGNGNSGQNQATPAAAPGAFSFSGTPAQPSIPTFDPNTKPVFNFSSGAPAPQFTAQIPDGGLQQSQQPRRIKKAVRRHPRPGGP